VYDAVLFDLFTALLDSQRAWRIAAGSNGADVKWREETTRLAYSAGSYRAFAEVVADAAHLAGIPALRAHDLLGAIAERVRPWPETQDVLRRLSERMRIGVVTNCSEDLGRRAAARVGVHFDVVVTAEAAGAYKPRVEPYRLALQRLRADPASTLFVAGTPRDIEGARSAGMDVAWHNRLRVPLGGYEPPLAELASLEELLPLV
jgi:2-haloalkanoic acid dehalogenase type II